METPSSSFEGERSTAKKKKKKKGRPRRFNFIRGRCKIYLQSRDLVNENFQKNTWSSSVVIW